MTTPSSLRAGDALPSAAARDPRRGPDQAGQPQSPLTVAGAARARKGSRSSNVICSVLAVANIEQSIGDGVVASASVVDGWLVGPRLAKEVAEPSGIQVRAAIGCALTQRGIERGADQHQRLLGKAGGTYP